MAVEAPRRTVWDVQNELGRVSLYGGFGFGWLLVLITTFVINTL